MFTPMALIFDRIVRIIGDIHLHVALDIVFVHGDHTAFVAEGGVGIAATTSLISAQIPSFSPAGRPAEKGQNGERRVIKLFFS
jgi:hypothetical protein